MLGLIFPGQGSQFVGMGKVFWENFTAVKQTFEEGSDCLSVNMKKLLFEGPDEDLKLTHNTQPAILLLSVALDRITKDLFKNEKKVVAGHSLGEYSALVSNGVLSLNESLRAVRTRGELMQKAVPVGLGSMAAVLGATDENVVRICEFAEKFSKFTPLEPANFNAPGQVVISGNAKAIEWLLNNFKTSEIAQEIKAKFIPLNVSAPFHCSMMKPAQDGMSPILNSLNYKVSNTAIIQNVTAMETNDISVIKNNLLAQISAPVRWVQSVNRMKQLGVQRVIELGPGKVLSGLVKKIDSENIQTLNMESIEDFKKIESMYA